jgi:hypothetical protein
MRIYVTNDEKNSERRLERLGAAEVFRAPSSSRKGIFHYVTVYKDGSVKCSCEGFSFNKKCWHIDALPICMEKDPKDFVPGRMVTPRTCSFVADHEGEHSWQVTKPV